ncbi:MAG: hypothetical protein O2923_06345 [Verrucomicrobia bacterium]|nr:hypothetical protein [Verrucomicrobiota bacterium]MDA1086691.1 hypothetical protein [Verrucomicrobiota bacterium]
MKPRIKLASTRTPDGSEIALYRHDDSYCIRVGGQVLMDSRQHESELELARLGCAHLSERREPSVLIGGLGLGYTLRQCLDMLSPGATVTICELMTEVIDWNQAFLGDLTGHPLRDKRVRLQKDDVLLAMLGLERPFDAIILDIDNGPSAMTDRGNRRLYGRDGVASCARALAPKGCLAVWSAGPDKTYERELMRCGLAVRRYRAPAYVGSKSQSRFVFVAARNKALLPPGGGEPMRHGKKSNGRE